ncbi:MAG: VacJ family lipoprotein [Gammaproteobacteria bacterium]|nr:MAG: VacJ family lipoprotein [Gammaproteobacteria bacterium]
MSQLIKTFIIPIVLLFSGCATTSTNEIGSQDPLETFNRASYDLNKTMDILLLKPMAKGYDKVMPKPAKVGISNFFSNLDEIPTIINSVLQGKFSAALSDTGRFLINTTLGLAGFIDVATDLDFEQHDEDFGQTLGYWGIESGPYLVLPLFGPSSLRDVVGRGVDGFSSAGNEIDHVPTRNSIYLAELIDVRYRLLAIDGQLEDALDEYSFVRDAYLMRRQYQVYDGDPPEEDDFYDDDCEDIEYCDDEIID